MTEVEKQQRISEIRAEIDRLKEAQTHLPQESDHFLANETEIKKLEEELNSLATGTNLGNL